VHLLIRVARDDNSIGTRGTSIDIPTSAVDSKPITKDIATNGEGTIDISSLIVDCDNRMIDNLGGIFATARNRGFPSFQMNIYDTKADIWISKYIKSHGCWECDLVGMILRTMRDTPNSFLLDMGGNIGMYSLSVSAMGREAYAFEPVKMNQNKICGTVVKNSFQNLTTLFGTALSDREEILHFQQLKQQLGKGHNMGGISLNKTSMGAVGEKYVDYSPAVSIDQLSKHLPSPEGRSVVIKIDNEGAECATLNGAIDYLSSLPIELVVMESNYDRLIDCQDKVFPLLLKNGLKPYKKGSYSELDVNKFDPGHWNLGAGSDIIWSKKRPQQL
ncbi:hypothetical protein THAOC_25786, partial [Thalassiosira oceanica]